MELLHKRFSEIEISLSIFTIRNGVIYFLLISVSCLAFHPVIYLYIILFILKQK
jgi:hypothetical protein